MNEFVTVIFNVDWRLRPTTKYRGFKHVQTIHLRTGIPVESKYFWYDILHKSDGPAVIKRSLETGGIIEFQYWENGELHRFKGPAIQRYNGFGELLSREWWIKNKRHREDGPALEIFGWHQLAISQQWYWNGSRHRENGPAIINTNYRYECRLTYNGYSVKRKIGSIEKAYFLNGKQVTNRGELFYRPTMSPARNPGNRPSPL